MTKRTTDSDLNVFERFIQQNRNIEPLLNGINNKKAALRAHRAAHKYDASKATKERIAELLREYD